MSELNCKVCDANDWQKIRTYKHRWWICNECHSAFAHRKDSYLFSSPLFSVPINLVDKLLGGKLGVLKADFLKNDELEQDESIYWSFYSEMLANVSELGIFSEEADDQFRWMEDLGIEWQGKRILCISTAPGVFAAKAAKSADVVVTEYSPGVVDAMSKHLGLNAVLYDFNSDELEDVVDGKFDLIFALGIVNWCADQRSFIQSMTKVLNPNGVVFIQNNTPSLGYILSWQFMDGMANIWIQNQAFLSLFYQSGPYKLVGKYSNKYNAYWYRFRDGGWKNKLQYIIRTPFWIVYGGLALLPWKNLNRKWWSNSYNFALRLESEDK